MKTKASDYQINGIMGPFPKKIKALIESDLDLSSIAFRKMEVDYIIVSEWYSGNNKEGPKFYRGTAYYKERYIEYDPIFKNREDFLVICEFFKINLRFEFNSSEYR